MFAPYLLLPKATDTVPGDSNCKHLHTAQLCGNPHTLLGKVLALRAEPEITRDETSLQTGVFVSMNVGCRRRKRLSVIMEK